LRRLWHYGLHHPWFREKIINAVAVLSPKQDGYRVDGKASIQGASKVASPLLWARFVDRSLAQSDIAGIVGVRSGTGGIAKCEIYPSFTNNTGYIRDRPYSNRSGVHVPIPTLFDHRRWSCTLQGPFTDA
jgi:hypothetical protein